MSGIIGTVAIILMITKYSVNNQEVSVTLFKLAMFIIVICCLWWKP